MKINFIDLKRQYLQSRTSINAAMIKVAEEAAFIMGPQVKELEQTLAQFVGVRHAVGCASGTDALLLALMTYDVQPGDEIITTPFTFFATAEVVSILKAKPVFVDIDPVTFNIDPSRIGPAVTAKTKGIIAVDIFGQCADYDAINRIAEEHRLFVIEDAAQSFGAEYKGRKAGSLAGIGCTSFFPAKPLGCFGDGGMIFTDDPKRAALMESLRNHGQGADKYDNVRIGLNSRLDNLQAAVLLEKFKLFPDEIVLRNRAAEYYRTHLCQNVTAPEILSHNRSVYAQYSLRVSNRARLQEALHAAGIPTAIHYAKPLHLQTAFAFLGHRTGDFPVSEEISRDILSIPMHPYLRNDEQDLVTDAINTFYKKDTAL